jgi:hypothetical protein
MTAVSPYIISVKDNSIFAEYKNSIPILDSITNTIALKNGSAAVAGGVTTFIQYGQPPFTDFGFTLNVPDCDQIGNPRTDTSCSIGARFYTNFTTVNPIRPVTGCQIYSSRNNLVVSAEESGRLILFNSIGQSVLQKLVNRNEIVSEKLQKGIYVVFFRCDSGKSVVNKIIIE